MAETLSVAVCEERVQYLANNGYANNNSEIITDATIDAAVDYLQSDEVVAKAETDPGRAERLARTTAQYKFEQAMRLGIDPTLLKPQDLARPAVAAAFASAELSDELTTV